MTTDIKKLFQAGVHFGHKTSRWSPHMKPYIWGAKNKIHLIDISKTALLLERAAQFLEQATRSGKQVIWVGTKKAAQPIIKKISSQGNMPYVINRWIGGTLSNHSQVKKAITRLLHLQDVLKKSSSHYTKKELSMLQKEIARLEKNIGGIINIEFPPAALIVVDAKREQSAIKEAVSLGIPVVAMVDTNTDPENINFVIPANDDSPKSISCILDVLCQAVQKGHDAYAQTKEKEQQERAAKSAAKKATKPADKKDVAENKEEVNTSSEKQEAAQPKTTEVKETKEAAPEKTETTKADTQKEAARETKEVKESAQEKVAEKKETKKATTEKKADAKDTKETKKPSATKKTATKTSSSTKLSSAKKPTTRKTTTTKKTATKKTTTKKVATKK